MPLMSSYTVDKEVTIVPREHQGNVSNVDNIEESYKTWVTEVSENSKATQNRLLTVKGVSALPAVAQVTNRDVTEIW